MQNEMRVYRVKYTVQDREGELLEGTENIATDGTLLQLLKHIEDAILAEWQESLSPEEIVGPVIVYEATLVTSTDKCVCFNGVR